MNLLKRTFLGTIARKVSRQTCKKLKAKPKVIRGILNSTKVALHIAFTLKVKIYLKLPSCLPGNIKLTWLKIPDPNSKIFEASDGFNAEFFFDLNSEACRIASS